MTVIWLMLCFRGMFHSPEQQQQNTSRAGNPGLGLMYFLARCLSTTVTPFMRKGFGVDWFDMQMVKAGLL
jgi:hypothetical protein